MLATGSVDGTIKLWKLQSQQEIFCFVQDFDYVYKLHF
ncbi:hypothetical protein ACF3DV_02310 [Chlorogloeopsis fritschii PCC 9212]